MAKSEGAVTGTVERTLADLTASIESNIFAEELAHKPGMLQSLDPRAKIMMFLALLLAISLSRSLPVLLGLYAFSLLLAWVSLVPLVFFIKRVWLFMPFFTGIIAIPALFNFITPGTPWVVLWSQPLVAITDRGVVTAAFLLLRVGASVSMGILLVLTTPWNALLKALSILRIPKVFILTLGMTYRYIYLLLHTANDMFLARKSRIVGRMDAAGERRWIAASMGGLLSRSFDLSNDVYLAMLSRGYRGDARVAYTFAFTVRDWLWTVGILAVAVVAIYLGR
ncbi:MAG: cobalt ECF transporter T component CbiQ [Chloroflexi bacterium]|nr:cobalt ECF transporter T component CbiQ [Chloroflexota bacterium]